MKCACVFVPWGYYKSYIQQFLQEFRNVGGFSWFRDKLVETLHVLSVLSSPLQRVVCLVRFRKK